MLLLLANMKILLFVCSFAVLIHSSLNYNYERKVKDGELVMLHLVFRHGDRTALKFLYPNDPYANLNITAGKLTQRGELTSRQLGLKFRRLYDEFLGFYKPNEVEALSSSVPRCVNTLRNMSTTMYPHMEPKEFKYTVIPAKEDKLIAIQLSCPTVITRKKFGAEAQDKDFFKTLSEVLGMEINSYLQILNLRDYIEVMAENGHAVPDFIKPYWGQILDIDDKALKMFIDETKKNIGGNLINKIAKDSLNINKKEPTKKLHLYSGHDWNLNAILSFLDVYGRVNYAGYVAFEVYKNKKEHFVEVYNDINNGRGRIQLKIPGCGFKCPLDKFVKFAQQFYLGDNWCSKGKKE